MKKLSLLVLTFLVVLFTSSFVHAVDKKITFSWLDTNPTEDLAGFYLYYGHSTTGAYDQEVKIPLNDPALNQNCTPVEGQNYCYTLTLPVADTGLFTYYFAAKAYRGPDELKSGYSNEVFTSFDFEVPPAVSDLSTTYDATNSALVFSWTYETAWLSRIEKWSLWESDVSGSAYTKVVDIPYDANATPPYTTSVTISVPEGSKVTKYYVLVTHRSGENNYAFSSNSNEVTVTINKMPPKSPFEFKIKVVN